MEASFKMKNVSIGKREAKVEELAAIMQPCQDNGAKRSKRMAKDLSTKVAPMKGPEVPMQ